MANTKNYFEPDGDTLVISGELRFEGDGHITGLTAEPQPDSTATTVAKLKDDFNALLAKLRTAGLIAE